MLPEDRVRIMHMIEAGQQVSRFTKGRKRSDLDDDEMLLLAVIRAIEIIGEAAAHVSVDTRLASPQVPWPQIIGMRNRLVHAYFDISREMVWKTATQRIPDLLAQLEALIDTSDTGEQ